MRQAVISIASGKGGTGKTTIAACLALSSPRPVKLLDCDVEEPNAHIFLKPEFNEIKPVHMDKPKIDDSKCTYCGLCAEICMYNALAVAGENVLTFPELCHSCGGCWLLCPEEAISKTPEEIGVIESGPAKNIEDGPGDPPDIQFVQGKLNVGVATTPPLIKAVKKEVDSNRLAILDAPPGTSCPVVETIENTDFVLLVTEPTAMGLSDLSLAIELTKVFNIPCGVIINRDNNTYQQVEKYCQEKNVPVLMKIPLDREIASAYSRGITPVHIMPELREKFAEVINYIERVTTGERTSHH